MPSKLWTRDFTIITLGTVVSLLGGSLTGFAVSLLVLDYTGSTFLYALFIVVFNAPKVFMPVLAGPYLDKFSRKKAIYSLDFCSSALLLLMFFLLRGGRTVGYGALLAFAVINGVIGSVYQVAYDSLYPNLITEGNLRKAYSISSMLYPLAAVMTPVAAWMYGTVGIAPIFLITAGCYFVAACFETQIRARETHLQEKHEPFSARQFRSDFREGVRYLRSEPGLMVITLYFAVNALTGEGAQTLLLPYFKSTPHLGELRYTYVMAFAVIGRLIGGMVHYRFRYPANRKLAIAIFVYTAISVIEGTVLFLPAAVMMAAEFTTGLMGVTSYNIRISGTQNYVPDDHRARFNGVFQMATTVGSICGPLLMGALGEALPIRGVIIGSSALNILVVYLVMYRGRDKVRPIYNQNL